MEENKIYKCGICGKKHDTVQSRMACEMTCYKRQQEEEKRLAEAKKNAEKEVRFTEASTALDKALKLVNGCVKDFGTFKYTGDLKDLELLNMDFFPIKLWHHFWH